MNFYDEAIEAKHAYQTDLIMHQRDLRALLRDGTLKHLEGNTVDIERLYDRDIATLEDADPYFWEPRITQLVLASGQQLPETTTFDPAWAKGQSGYWWFGPSSPLIGVSGDAEKKYVNALLWNLAPNGSLSIKTLWMDGRTQKPLGSLVWHEGETLEDALRRLQEAAMKSRATYTPELVLTDIAIQLASEVSKLSDESMDLTRQMQAKAAEIIEMGGEGHLPDHNFDADLKAGIERHEWERQRIERFNGEHARREAEWKQASLNALITFACGCLWLQQKIVVTAPAQLTRAAERRLGRAGISTRCLIVHLRSKQYTHTSTEEESRHTDWAWQWAVRGHWREQPTKEGYKLIWIHPFIKGPEDKPLKPTAARVFAVTR